MNTSNWKKFRVGDVFESSTTRPYIFDDEEAGPVPYITRTAENNGCDGHIAMHKEYLNKGDCITIGAEGIYAFYQPEDFIAGVKVYTLRNSHMTPLSAEFICTLLNQADYKYSYGRARILGKIVDEIIILPVDSSGNPDWDYMEEFMESLHSKPITTSVKSSHVPLETEKWGQFKIGELFTVKYGVNLELNSLDQTNCYDPEGIAFVSRTESNNGVSAYVKRIPEIEPQPAHILTVAGGGSVLSTFLQNREFYSGRDLYLLLDKQPLSDECKLFVKTVIEQDKYRFNYGRQANSTLPNLEIRLPHTPSGEPDWIWMENYMKSLPFSDRIAK